MRIRNDGTQPIMTGVTKESIIDPGKTKEVDDKVAEKICKLHKFVVSEKDAEAAERSIKEAQEKSDAEMEEALALVSEKEKENLEMLDVIQGKERELEAEKSKVVELTEGMEVLTSELSDAREENKKLEAALKKAKK